MRKAEWIDELQKTRRNRQGIGMYVMDSFDEEAAELLSNYEMDEQIELLNDVSSLILDESISREDVYVILQEKICKITCINEEQMSLDMEK